MLAGSFSSYSEITNWGFPAGFVLLVLSCVGLRDRADPYDYNRTRWKQDLAAALKLPGVPDEIMRDPYRPTSVRDMLEASQREQSLKN
jgi:hypothetical protein